MLDADLLGKGLCPGDLVIFFTEVKSDGKGLLTLKVRRDIRGIDAGGKEAAYLDIRDLMRTDRIMEGLGDCLYPVSEQRLLIRLKML